MLETVISFRENLAEFTFENNSKSLIRIREFSNSIAWNAVMKTEGL